MRDVFEDATWTLAACSSDLPEGSGGVQEASKHPPSANALMGEKPPGRAGSSTTPAGIRGTVTRARGAAAPQRGAVVRRLPRAANVHADGTTVLNGGRLNDRAPNAYLEKARGTRHHERPRDKGAPTDIRKMGKDVVDVAKNVELKR